MISIEEQIDDLYDDIDDIKSAIVRLEDIKDNIYTEWKNDIIEYMKDYQGKLKERITHLEKLEMK